eukprot:jgi/Tetstr1/427226/TSEL_017414.t1
MTAAKEMRQKWQRWNPEAHIGDDGYVLADGKATRDAEGGEIELTRGANAPRPGQRGANARRPAQRGANARRPAQRGANESQGHIFPWRCRISASPTRISAYGGKSSNSLSPNKLRKKYSKKRGPTPP